MSPDVLFPVVQHSASWMLFVNTSIVASSARCVGAPSPASPSAVLRPLHPGTLFGCHINWRLLLECARYNERFRDCEH